MKASFINLEYVVVYFEFMQFCTVLQMLNMVLGFVMFNYFRHFNLPFGKNVHIVCMLIFLEDMTSFNKGFKLYLCCEFDQSRFSQTAEELDLLEKVCF